MSDALSLVAIAVGVAAIVWGAERFAEHLGTASARLGVSTFALALLLAGAEPEELVTAVIASARKVPALALGDVVGANVAMCFVALGVGALVAPLPFGPRVRRYAWLGLPPALVAVALAWDGRVGRGAGALLVALYVVYVAVIWIMERRPPALGETGEVEPARSRTASARARVGRELLFVLVGVLAMAAGASLLVEAVRNLTHVESTQTALSLTLVGFVTAFELVALAWSASRRGASEAVVAAVVGSFAYNVTMTLGVAALVRPLVLVDASLLRGPFAIMLGAMLLVLALGTRGGRLDRARGFMLLACYPVFVTFVVVR
jgi:cation:H+ antiporter